MTDDSLLPFDLPSVQRKKVSAAFDGGLISSDGGPVLLREAERRLRLAEPERFTLCVDTTATDGNASLPAEAGGQGWQSRHRSSCWTTSKAWRWFPVWNGCTLVYILSEDNFNFLQRTLRLLFRSEAS